MILKNRTLLIIFFLSAVSFLGCKNSDSKQLHSDNKIDIQRDKVVNYAKKQLGVKYVYGGNTPKGFDCSGFTKYVYSNFGYTVPRRSVEYSTTGKKVSLSTCKKADIILFTGSNKSKRVTGHVAIVVSNSEGVTKFIHASSSRGIVISDMKVKYYQDRILGVRRIIY
ncbi:MAG: C40 family peptidase [Bacteroidales bacterium]|nr:C40 family peptidase [Bacteroidales bacterium]